MAGDSGRDERSKPHTEPFATRIDGFATRLDGAQTRRDTKSSDAGLTNLPDALAERFEIVRGIATMGSEADLLIVRPREGSALLVAKVYRLGFNPKSEILDTISRSNPEHVISLIEHGSSSGRWYELLEYVPLGSLSDVFPPGCQIDDSVLMQIVRELNDALQHLHEQGIIHRDLKPANVLVRSLEPLDLVLTDFGIASRSESTVHFTSMNRTVAYGAPETIAGEVSSASDYWSLGIIMAELVAGAHPLKGLSEHAIAGSLIKSSIRTEHLPPSWRGLCTGLLQRNPRTRWCYPEVERWLSGDATLIVPIADVAPAVLATKPYTFAMQLHHDASQLARSLARNRDEAHKHLARGYVSSWIARDLNDHGLASYVDDCTERYGEAPDLLVLAVTARMDPNMDVSYRGLRMATPDILDCSIRATKGNGHVPARELISELFERDVLEVYAAASGNAQVMAVAKKWRGLILRFESHLKYFSTMLGVRQAAVARSADVRGALLAAAANPEIETVLRRYARSLLDDERFDSAFNSKRFTAWLTSHPRDAAATLAIGVFLGPISANQALINACRRSSIDVSRWVESAIRSGANPTWQDEEGYSALHWIAEHGRSPRSVRLLLDHGASLEAVDRVGRTPLIVAAATNDAPEVLRELVHRGARLDAVDPTQSTALQIGHERGAPHSVLEVLEPTPVPPKRKPPLPTIAGSAANPPGCMGASVVTLVATLWALAALATGMV